MHTVKCLSISTFTQHVAMLWFKEVLDIDVSLIKNKSINITWFVYPGDTRIVMKFVNLHLLISFAVV